jgi:hypothetical protein
MDSGDPAEEATRRAEEEKARHAEEAAAAAADAEWHIKERKLRKREVTSGFWGTWAQLLIGLTAITAAVVAVISANVARTAVQATLLTIDRQSEESRLSTAVTAIGGTTPADRAAGMELLRRLVEQRLTAAEATPANSWDRADAHGLYVSSTVILANYLRSITADVTDEPHCLSPMPLDDQYAADGLQQLLSLLSAKTAKEVLDMGAKPSIDLSTDKLCQQFWAGIRFDGLHAADLKNIDLRGADLQWSVWGHANLKGADLQCTHLYHANLRQADLTNADLRGADLYNADLSQATLTGANLSGADLLNTKLPPGYTPADWADTSMVKPGPWDPGPCLAYTPYWTSPPAGPGALPWRRALQRGAGRRPCRRGPDRIAHGWHRVCGPAAARRSPGRARHVPTISTRGLVVAPRGRLEQTLLDLGVHDPELLRRGVELDDTALQKLQVAPLTVPLFPEGRHNLLTVRVPVSV